MRSKPATTTRLFGNLSPLRLLPLGPNTLHAGWSLSSPSGRNALQYQSRTSIDTKYLPSKLFSDSVLFCPPNIG
uniref:Uncharacterized protein n=1 Tax=Rhizophora mucronata TaxID=61149 RepID=A0A2P2NAI9_RHIMU